MLFNQFKSANEKCFTVQQFWKTGNIYFDESKNKKSYKNTSEHIFYHVNSAIKTIKWQQSKTGM